jgi:hypothetical protein
MKAYPMRDQEPRMTATQTPNPFQKTVALRAYRGWEVRCYADGTFAAADTRSPALGPVEQTFKAAVAFARSGGSQPPAPQETCPQCGDPVGPACCEAALAEAQAPSLDASTVADEIGTGEVHEVEAEIKRRRAAQTVEAESPEGYEIREHDLTGRSLGNPILSEPYWQACIAQYGGVRNLAMANLSNMSEHTQAPLVLLYEGRVIATARGGLGRVA